MLKRIVAFLAPAVAIALLAACAASYQPPLQHPEELAVGQRPLCTDCHEARGEQLSYERFNHTPYFGENHRREATQSEQVCAMCHAASFCHDCHAVRVELKPSIKNQGDTFRRMPHRGDYLSRHIIDARIDPTSCFRCHGNPKAAITCAPCHGS